MITYTGRAAEAHTNTSDSSIQMVLSGIAAGSFVVVGAGVDGDFHINSVVDDLSVEGVAAGAEQQPTSGAIPRTIRLFYFVNYGGGDRTFTVSFSGSGTERHIVIAEFTGVPAISPQDGAGFGAEGLSDPVDMGTFSPSGDGRLLIGQVVSWNALDAPAPFTAIYDLDFADGSAQFLNFMYYIQSTQSDVDAAWTSGYTQWIADGAMFKSTSNLISLECINTLPNLTVI